jgi:hypothetical protein
MPNAEVNSAPARRAAEVELESDRTILLEIFISSAQQ